MAVERCYSIAQKSIEFLGELISKENNNERRLSLITYIAMFSSKLKLLVYDKQFHSKLGHQKPYAKEILAQSRRSLTRLLKELLQPHVDPLVKQSCIIHLPPFLHDQYKELVNYIWESSSNTQDLGSEQIAHVILICREMIFSDSNLYYCYSTLKDDPYSYLFSAHLQLRNGNTVKGVCKFIYFLLGQDALYQMRLNPKLLIALLMPFFVISIYHYKMSESFATKKSTFRLELPTSCWSRYLYKIFPRRVQEWDRAKGNLISFWKIFERIGGLKLKRDEKNQLRILQDICVINGIWEYPKSGLTHTSDPMISVYVSNQELLRGPKLPFKSGENPVNIEETLSLNIPLGFLLKIRKDIVHKIKEKTNTSSNSQDDDLNPFENLIRPIEPSSRAPIFQPTFKAQLKEKKIETSSLDSTASSKTTVKEKSTLKEEKVKKDSHGYGNVTMKAQQAESSYEAYHEVDDKEEIYENLSKYNNAAKKIFEFLKEVSLHKKHQRLNTPNNQAMFAPDLFIDSSDSCIICGGMAKKYDEHKEDERHKLVEAEWENAKSAFAQITENHALLQDYYEKALSGYIGVDVEEFIEDIEFLLNEMSESSLREIYKLKQWKKFEELSQSIQSFYSTFSRKIEKMKK
eukprot:TRINITY_DN13851_c0_g7_i1.p1 TRINITY_DN13851_c0_g7~~TRINITY_DN13851_c0_g7_i1.p1  ORF type:complete len:690 (+),score=163.20 TRINITY_DN13851_c0_g7_i1:180-2072(+)